MTRRTVALLAGFALAGLVALLPGTPPVVGSAAPVDGPDLCLAVAPEVLEEHAREDAWRALVAGLAASFAGRPTLIPEPLLVEDRAADRWRVALWSGGASAAGGLDAARDRLAEASCGPSSAPWSVTVSGEFLRAGTRRELAAAPTTPGFDSSIDVEWLPGEARVRTVLRFSGPFGIPNGTCWLDDVLVADGRGGATASWETGASTSPFGEGVCGRFEAFLAEGGAGAQALALLPSEVVLADGARLRLVASSVEVDEAGIVVAGALEGV